MLTTSMPRRWRPLQARRHRAGSFPIEGLDDAGTLPCPLAGVGHWAQSAGDGDRLAASSGDADWVLRTRACIHPERSDPQRAGAPRLEKTWRRQAVRSPDDAAGRCCHSHLDAGVSNPGLSQPARHFDNKIQTKYKDKAKQIGLENKSQEAKSSCSRPWLPKGGRIFVPSTATLRWVHPGEHQGCPCWAMTCRRVGRMKHQLVRKLLQGI